MHSLTEYILCPQHYGVSRVWRHRAKNTGTVFILLLYFISGFILLNESLDNFLASISAEICIDIKGEPFSGSLVF